MNKGKEIRRRLAVIFGNNSPHRYIPRAIGNGPGWHVYDRKLSRSLSDDEVLGLTFENVCEKIVN